MGKEESFTYPGHETHRTQLNVGHGPYSSVDPFQAPLQLCGQSQSPLRDMEEEGRSSPTQLRGAMH